MSTFIVLLRAIGPITHKLMSMKQWRDGVEAEGFSNAETYLATGNMLVDGEGTPAAVTRRMNAIMQNLGLGLGNVAVVRKPAQLETIFKANPFPETAVARPSEMGVYFFAAEQPDFGWVKDYDGDERVAVVGTHLVVDYSGRISQSLKLPGIIEKRSGVATARNWNTLRGLIERAADRKSKDH